MVRCPWYLGCRLTIVRNANKRAPDPSGSSPRSKRKSPDDRNDVQWSVFDDYLSPCFSSHPRSCRQCRDEVGEAAVLVADKASASKQTIEAVHISSLASTCQLSHLPKPQRQPCATHPSLHLRLWTATALRASAKRRSSALWRSGPDCLPPVRLCLDRYLIDGWPRFSGFARVYVC